jgi:hypothetical protein
MFSLILGAGSLAEVGRFGLSNLVFRCVILFWAALAYFSVFLFVVATVDGTVSVHLQKGQSDI